MAATGGVRHAWSAHPWRARSVRLLVYLLPVAASLAVVRVITDIGGVPTGSLGVFLLWWLGISVCATVVVSGAYRLTRRLLPLGTLLELSLVFPDEAPSRFKLAMRSGTVESLEERLRSARAEDTAPSAQESAELLLCLVEALDAHDKITRGHAERVRGYASSLGRQLKLPADELDRLNWAALLHDIGKLEVSAEILNKPGRPTDEEWEALRLHPLRGETLVEPLREWLGDWSAAVGYHHENWDGSGYPRGIAGEAIPLAGRIVAIADVYDVITSARSYKEPASAAEARSELARCAGTQFDPRLVRAFVDISLGRLRLLLGPLSWLTHAPLLARVPVTTPVISAVGGLAALATALTVGIVAPSETARAASPSGTQPAQALARSRPIDAVQPLPSRTPLRLASRGEKTVSPGCRSHPGAERCAPAIAPTAMSPVSTPTPTEAPPPPLTSPAPPTTSPAPAPVPLPATPPEPEPPTPVTPSPPPPPPVAAPAPQPPPPPVPLPQSVNIAPNFTAGANQTVQEDASAQTVNGWAFAIAPGPANESAQTVSFTASTTNPGLFTTQPAVAPDGTLTYTPAPNANGVATVTVTAIDNGGTTGGGADTSTPQTFTLTIDPVNDAPSFTIGSNQTALEDASAQTVNGWATAIAPGPTDESAQTVSFTASTTNPGLFTTQPAVAPDGTLTYTPAPNANGVATVTVTAIDNGGTTGGGADTSTPQTFTLTIDPVNDAPSFTIGSNQTVISLLGAQSIAGWATGAAPGPTDESAQTVSFTVSTTNPGLFTAPPAVAPDGTLTYTPTLLAIGTATITVRALDDGGTANGGADTSTPQTFTITII